MWWWRRAVVVGALLAVLSPAVRDRDSFPLSTYPVYATVRPRTATFATAAGIGSDGGRRRLTMRTIADTDDPLIAESRVAGAVASGHGGDLCREIAGRAPNGVVAVSVVIETHDVVDAAGGRPSLRERRVVSTCAVRR
jgi:hypothetical protein